MGNSRTAEIEGAPQSPASSQLTTAFTTCLRAASSWLAGVTSVVRSAPLAVAVRNRIDGIVSSISGRSP